MGTTQRSAPATMRGSDASKAALRRRGMRLAVLIIVWDVIEGVVAVTAGIAAGSIALIGFGIDSSIEVFAASIVVWNCAVAAHRNAGGEPCT